ncbi:MAG: phosphoglycerate dehydrogenase [Bacteroidetes bacterium]|nr:phosphoglycerate dehydrogenase [Bacteroidota bacterium]
MKILISDNLNPQCVEILTRDGFEVENRPGIPPADLLAAIGECDALLVRSATKVTAEVIAAGRNLKVVGRAGTGVDNIDVQAATRKGVVVMNTPGGNTVSAAEHAVSMMLSLARNIPQAHASLTGGAWDRKSFTGTEVFEKTVGVIGLGKIGREVAARCKGLGMTAIGYDPVLGADASARLGIEPVTLDELYRRADFITVHTPLTAETTGLLNDAAFEKCKKGVRVVNCARGGIVEEGALLRALQSGRVAGAALDVFATEPPKGNPLVGHPRVVVTPHLGASTEEAQEKVAIQIAHAVGDALHGRGYAGVVNSSALGAMLQGEMRPYVSLAEKLGSAAAQLARGKVKKVTIGVAGDQIAGSVEVLKAGVLKGVLSHAVPDPVNVVSAPFLAQEMGLAVGVRQDPAEDDFPVRVSVTYETDQDVHELSGVVFGRSAARLIALDRYRLNVNPEGFLLIYKNLDRPGMLARVGSILAEHGVNIGEVSLGRSAAGAEALTIMSVDSRVPGAALDGISRVDGVSGVRVVDLH